MVSQIDKSLSKKYESLQDKWYVFALDAMEYSIFMIAGRILGHQKDEYSLYNILRGLYDNDKYIEIIPKEKQNLFLTIVNIYDIEIVDIYI